MNFKNSNLKKIACLTLSAFILMPTACVNAMKPVSQHPTGTAATAQKNTLEGAVERVKICAKNARRLLIESSPVGTIDPAVLTGDASSYYAMYEMIHSNLFGLHVRNAFTGLKYEIENIDKLENCTLDNPALTSFRSDLNDITITQLVKHQPTFPFDIEGYIPCSEKIVMGINDPKSVAACYLEFIFMQELFNGVKGIVLTLDSLKRDIPPLPYEFSRESLEKMPSEARPTPQYNSFERFLYLICHKIDSLEATKCELDGCKYCGENNLYGTLSLFIDQLLHPDTSDTRWLTDDTELDESLTDVLVLFKHRFTH